MADLSGDEQAELLKLLEEEDVIEPPTIVFTVRHICSNEPPRVLRTGMYPSWYQGCEWWNALPIAKRRELIAQEQAAQAKR
jgi:hypothetical protein